MTTLRVGIAGYGVVGKRRKEVVDRRTDMTCVAVCDRSFSDEGTLPDGVRYYRTYQRLLEAESLDTLIVCLTNDIAAEVTCAALELGLHVFCEKPPGRDLKDIQQVVETARRHDGQVMKYGFNHRYHDSVREALAMRDSATLGRVLNMRGIYGKSQFISFGAHSDWRTQRAIAGGGILLDQGIHLVDLMRLFGGEFNEVKSFISNDFWGHDVEDNAYALMRSRTGVIAMLHSTATQWRHRFHLEITLERGALILSGILSGSKSYGAETLKIVWAGDDDQGDPKEQTIRYNHDPSWEEEIAEFAEACLTGSPVRAGSPTDALETMRLVYRIYCADPEWKTRWNLDDELSA